MKPITKEIVENEQSHKLIRVVNAPWAPGVFSINVPGMQHSLTFEKNKAVKVSSAVADILLDLKYKAGTSQYGGKFQANLFEVATAKEYTSTDPRQIAAEVDVLKTQLSNLMKLLPKDAAEQMLAAGIDPIEEEQAEADGEYVEDVEEIERIGVVMDGTTPITQDGCLICPQCGTWKTKAGLETERAKRSLAAHMRKVHANTSSEG